MSLLIFVIQLRRRPPLSLRPLPRPFCYSTQPGGRSDEACKLSEKAGTKTDITQSRTSKPRCCVIRAAPERCVQVCARTVVNATFLVGFPSVLRARGSHSEQRCSLTFCCAPCSSHRACSTTTSQHHLLLAFKTTRWLAYHSMDRFFPAVIPFCATLQVKDNKVFSRA